MAVFRIYVEKKPAFAVEADSTRSDIRASLGIDLKGLRLLNRYDVEGIDGRPLRPRPVPSSRSRR